MKIKEYMLTNYDYNALKDIADHGCSGGIGGFIYYTETNKFHDDYEEEIWDMLHDDATDQGYTIMELISKFNGQKEVGSMTQLKNLLCWYAVERTAQNIVCEIDQKQEEKI